MAVPRMLRAGRRAMVMQIDIYGDGERRRSRRNGDREFRHHRRRNTEGSTGRTLDRGRYTLLRRSGNVITTQRESSFQGDRHAVSRAFLSGVRRRQPHVRAAGSADEVPAGQAQERHRLRAGPRSHQDRGARPHQRVHPEPDLREGRQARRPGGLLPQRRAGQDLPRDPGRADEGDPRLPRTGRAAGGDGRARHRLRADVPDAGQPGRRAHEGRPGDDPRRHPRAQRVDARDTGRSTTKTASSPPR